MEIQIVSIPFGPAPKEFREAWIGIILPVGGALLIPISMPPFLYPCWIEDVNTIEQARKLAFLKIERNDLPAFLIPVIPAIQKLAAKNKDAALVGKSLGERRADNK